MPRHALSAALALACLAPLGASAADYALNCGRVFDSRSGKMLDARTDAELSTSQLRREVEDLNRQRDAVTNQLGSLFSGLSGIVPPKG